MYTKGFSPLEPTEGQVYLPSFENSYWNLDSSSEPFRSTKGLSVTDRSLIGLSTLFYTGLDSASQVGLEATFLPGSEFKANDFVEGSLVKTTYEAVTIRRSLRRRNTEGGEFSSREWPTGFSVNYRHRAMHATYTRRVGLHMIAPAKKGDANAAARIRIKRDFRDGDTVSGEVLNIVDFGTGLDAQINPELHMEADVRDGWKIGQTYASHASGTDSLIRPRYSGLIRILKSEIFIPVKPMPRGPRRQDPKTTKAVPIIGLHT